MKKITSLLLVLMASASALFGQTKTTYCDSVSVTFSATETSSGIKFTYKVSTTTRTTPTVIAQEWNFGDGTSANTVDAVKVYTKSGSFYPCITVKVKNPRDNTYCYLKFCDSITIKDPCAGFNPSMGVTVGNNGEVTFEASASNTSTAYTYSWSFGDNTTGTDRTGTHTYKAGTYKICVTITDPKTKCSKTLCKEVTITGSDPCASFNPTVTVNVDPNGVLSYSGSTTSYSYSWDFGDGTSSTTYSGTHQYKAGTYKLCVTISGYVNNTKCTKTLCKEITVTSNDPCKDFNPTFRYEIATNGLVYFIGSDLTTSTLTYTWSYGDGTSGTGSKSSHTYKPGTYKVCVTVYDSKTGCKKTICQEITVQGTNTDPCKDFNPDWSYKVDGNVVIFEGHGTTYTYKWSANGAYYTDRTFKVDFKKPGTYKVCVVITDPKTKCSKTVCKEIVIKGKDTTDPCKNFNPTISFKTDGLNVYLAVDGGKGATMEWNFGDGSKGSTDRKVMHTYKKDGKYTICVTVYDAKRQCKKTICFTIEVKGKTSDPCADFNPDFTYKVSGNTVTVEGKNMSGVEYSWSWGDKLGDKGRTGSHTYKVAGKYQICMTAYNPTTKCTKTVCKYIEAVGQKMMGQDNGGKEVLLAYPNPVSTNVSIVTLSESPATISVKDMYGVEVMKVSSTPDTDKAIHMVVDNLPRGSYYVIVEQDGKISTTKFVK